MDRNEEVNQRRVSEGGSLEKLVGVEPREVIGVGEGETKGLPVSCPMRSHR